MLLSTIYRRSHARVSLRHCRHARDCRGSRPGIAGDWTTDLHLLAAGLAAPDLVLLHVADQVSSYAEGHIPGARFIRYGDVAVDGLDDLGAELPSMVDLKGVFEEAGVSDASRVVIYGAPVAAARVFFTLDVTGHPRVALLDGGLAAWRAEGRPIATGPENRASRKGTFTPRVNAARLATADWIRAQGSAIALVDVRSDPEFTGFDDGMGGAHAAGHIQGARQLTWGSLVGTDGRFLPTDQLRAKLEAAGAVSGKPVVSYCMVGMRASVVYFVARHLGLDALLYDGSIVDWSRRRLPIKTGR